MENFSLESISSQKGKVAIVTGANNGIGFETALALAKKKATVILACRSLAKAQKAMSEILPKVPDADLEILLVDLMSLESVRAFAKEFSKKYDRLDFLIANAGIMMPPFQITKDGFESQFGVNFLAHFVLVKRLFPILKTTLGSRVVMLSSLAHKNAKIDFTNLNAEKNYSTWKVYGQSKLACLIFAYELQRRIEDNGLKLKSLAAHPGFSSTNLGHLLPSVGAKLFAPFASFIGQDAKAGALPILQAALDPSANGGEYFGPSGFKEIKGLPKVVSSSSRSHDLLVASKLWTAAEEMTHEKFEI
ncbi:oxidoreductase [Algoriphagus winogradskyi]|uniref:NAD(P)-dependent dehydrogenase, short-chain alcohol dehydrogenase family n=1 Tax=Algoriphagus winogradskyi TaxID=237017 RepID=A0ABY1P4E1_9BACT|nr:oxidoreductase [Algoriphagus winogradskyi]SMP25993.1 NAD(P)-dependent dehydrogenase, short-chain alcohol dehydrogenase family [Algoriphagus winogradskyi]